MNNKTVEFVMNYCKRELTNDFYALDNYQTNARVLREYLSTGEIDLDELQSCPSSCGLDDYDGMCWLHKADKCEHNECWKKALDTKIEEMKPLDKPTNIDVKKELCPHCGR